ncbi:hypothetical protein JW499_21305, partial [Amphritea sp. ZJ14W]|nr:hypothetical protein [Amphritea pacifica]MBN1009179.1 hypothetical protein [Amphritea pacifica]
MKTSILLTSAAIGCVLAGTAQAQLAFDANLELDTDAVDTATSSTTYDQNGFVELNVASKRENGEY